MAVFGVNPGSAAESPLWDCRECDRLFYHGGVNPSRRMPAEVPPCPYCNPQLRKETAVPTLEEILGPTLAAQARLNPQPADIRGHILARINKWVPVGEDVEAWLVANHNQPTPPAPTPPRGRRIEVECTESGTESGRASYSCSYTATGTISLPEDRLQQMIRDAGNRADAITAFEEWADDHQGVDDYDRSDYSYADEEPTDSEPDERDHNARSVIEAYLDEHPELLEEDAEEEPTEQQVTATNELAAAPQQAVETNSETEGEYQHAEDTYQSEAPNVMPF